MPDQHKDYAYSLVATAPSPATSGTSMVCTAGEGARFPSGSFDVEIWPASARPGWVAGGSTGGNVERCRATISTDTFTLTRAQDGTTARTVVVGDQIVVPVTTKTLNDAEKATWSLVTQSSHGFAVGDVLYYTGSAYAKAKADAASTSEVVGIVTASIDTNTFALCTHGLITGLSGLTAGTVYFLSPSSAGALTATETSTVGQVSKPILVANTTTSGFLFNFRGAVITTSQWTADLSESGASLTNWTQETGSWTVVSSAFSATTAATTANRLRLTAQKRQSGLIYQADVKLVSGSGHTGESRVGIHFGWDGSSTGGVSVFMRCTSTLAPESTGQVYVEQQGGVAAAGTVAHNFNIDTFYTLTVVAVSSGMFDVYIDGVYIGTWGDGVPDQNLVYLAVIAYNCTGRFKNIKSSYLTPPTLPLA